MNAQAALVAKMFYWSAALVGVPSVLGFVGFGILSLVLWFQRPNANSTDGAKVSDSLVNVVVVMAGWVGKVLGALLGVAEGLIQILTVVCLVGTVFAGLLFLTARGIAVNATWARIVGSLLMGVLLLISGLASLSAGGGVLRLIPLLLLILSGYSLWLMWRGFA